MNKEGAIKAIKNNWPPLRYTILIEALELAIAALESKEQDDEAMERAYHDWLETAEDIRPHVIWKAACKYMEVSDECI